MKKQIRSNKSVAPLPSAFFDESKDKVVGDGRKVNNAVRHFIRDDYIRKKVRRSYLKSVSLSVIYIYTHLHVLYVHLLKIKIRILWQQQRVQ